MVPFLVAVWHKPTRGSAVAPGGGGADCALTISPWTGSFLADSDWETRFRTLFQFVDAVLPQPAAAACYELEQMGEANHIGAEVLVRVRVLARNITEARPARHPAGPSVAVLRTRQADWNIVSQRSGSFRALWTAAVSSLSGPILDARVGPAFLATQAVLQQHTVVQVAELFCGGFCGWTQGGWALRHSGIPFHTAWHGL